MASRVRFMRRLSSILSSSAPRIEAMAAGTAFGSWGADDLKRAMFAERDKLFDLSPESLAWYYVFQLAYELARSSGHCRCAYLLVDNVDGLDPRLQRNIASFGHLLCDVLRARTVVAMRPLTWKNTQGEFLVDVKEHLAPLPGGFRWQPGCILFRQHPEGGHHGTSEASDHVRHSHAPTEAKRARSR